MFTLSILSQPYAQRADAVQPSWLDKMAERLRIGMLIRWRFTPRRLDAIAELVARQAVSLGRMDEPARQRAFAVISRDLRLHGFTKPAVTAAALAIAQVTAAQTLGMTPHPAQIKGAYVLLQGHVAEMDTGEGKTLTASLAAACAAMAKLKVHVITVNDYLAQRDAVALEPFFSRLGFRVGVVHEGMPPEEKHQAYRADIVYCANKIIVFDYLRDRVALGERMRPFAMALDKLGEQTSVPTSLPGLQFAIVDEADSVFVDEARTPLIISEEIRDLEMEAYYREAFTLALALKRGEDYELQERGRWPRLKQAGRERLAQMTADLSGLWQGEKRREETIAQALIALHGFQRDVDYIVRDGKVVIVDEHTGRVMPDRSWERGLQQLMEVKEGLEPSALKETLARLSYQIFFRRYVHLCGMTGTCHEVRGELGEIYAMGVVRIAPHRPSRRRHLPTRLYANAQQRWEAVAQEITHYHARGQPVLVGTRSILASEHLSQLLIERGIAHQVLNAKQHNDEADIVAGAGAFYSVTIATNMAGRGTDIKLAEGVAERGGLHVVLTEGHDNRRVDRQLAGRCARQGDPGSWREILCLDDELMSCYPASFVRSIAARLPAGGRRGPWQALGVGLYRLAQSLLSARHHRARTQLLKTEYQNRRTLSFSGTTE